MTGKIIRVVADRGFLFIAPDDVEQRRDIFAHITSFCDFVTLDESIVGKFVVFDTEATEKGVKATGVRFVD
jgi:cold shock CspA family protein